MLSQNHIKLVSGRVKEGEEEVFTGEQALKVIDYEHKEQFDQVTK